MYNSARMIGVLTGIVVGLIIAFFIIRFVNRNKRMTTADPRGGLQVCVLRGDDL